MAESAQNTLENLCPNSSRQKKLAWPLQKLNHIFLNIRCSDFEKKKSCLASWYHQVLNYNCDRQKYLKKNTKKTWTLEFLQLHINLFVPEFILNHILFL